MRVAVLIRTVWGRVALAVALIGIVALVDWRVEPDIAFGFLYVFPMFLLGTVWPRSGLVAVAGLCTALADLYDPYPFVLIQSVAHDILVFISLAGTGLYAHAVTQSRLLAREADEQFELLVNTSPAAILTTTDDGTILLANTAAHRVLRAEPETLPGRNIRRFLPALTQIPPREKEATPLQSTLQCRATRETGEGFLADVFFAAYRTARGPRLAAVIVDVSEALRERELTGLDQLLAGSRVLVSAVLHEVRNLASALTITTQTLGRGERLAGNRDFVALEALVRTVSQLASAGLARAATDTEATTLDVAEVVEDLRLVLDPYCEEAEIALLWEVRPRLPRVWADRHRLLQVLLNLVRNSERALESSSLKRIDVTISGESDRVAIRVTDSGPGPLSPEHLFEPFQEGARATGLGLYLSRALVRAFGGELRYDPIGPGCSFVIELPVGHPGDTPPSVTHGGHSTVAR
jgi:PAS domain S-box-containing protein